MAEKEEIFSSKIKFNGLFSFRDFYEFCYQWLTEETNLTMSENKYEEKLSGDSKEIKVEWTGSRKLTDYFRFDIDVKFRILGLTKVQVTRDGNKIDTNKGSVEVAVKGILVRDYQGKFEMTARKKFMRAIYEKWVIPSRIEQFEGKIIGYSDEFLGQAKAWLDLEGKK